MQKPFTFHLPQIQLYMFLHFPVHMYTIQVANGQDYLKKMSLGLGLILPFNRLVLMLNQLLVLIM
jgi:hypothetical protein